ncbi:putative Ig domain-containing protein [uncultured Shewanella sp.]|uniref:putative Ig domain-containing protein n=1 Tax=uncultured Shewanella sp. TaxID=173975 RepID=UPI00261CF97F|nr:putative Ig domain-containing protein [uncultured Shewanella sp.]
MPLSRLLYSLMFVVFIFLLCLFSTHLIARSYFIDLGKQNVFGENAVTLIEHPPSAGGEPRSQPSYTQLAIAPGDPEYLYAATLTHGVIAYRYQLSDRVEGGFDEVPINAVSPSVFESTRNTLNGQCNEPNPGQTSGDSCHGSIGIAFHYDPEAINHHTSTRGKVFMYLAPTVVLHNSGGSNFFQNIIRLSDDDGDRVWGETVAEGNEVDEVRQVIADSISVSHHQIQQMHVSGHSLFISLGSRGDTQTNEHAYTAAILFIENLLTLNDTDTHNLAWYDIGGHIDPSSFANHGDYIEALLQEHSKDVQVLTNTEPHKIRNYAQGLRNPFGLATDQLGKLYTSMHAVNDASSIAFLCPNQMAEDGTPRDQFYQLVPGTDYGCPKSNLTVGDWRDVHSTHESVLQALALGVIEPDPDKQGRPVLMLEYEMEKIPPSGIDFVTATGDFYQSAVMGSWSAQNAVFLLNQTSGVWSLDTLISNGPHQPQSTKFLNGILDVLTDQNGDLLMASHRGEFGGNVGSGIWYVDVVADRVNNQPPSFRDTSIVDHTVMIGEYFSFFPAWHDGDEQDIINMSFSIVNAPTWLSINALTGEVFGTPSCSDLGNTENIYFVISDGMTTASSPVFTITVAGEYCNPKMEHGVLADVSNYWQTITLSQSYDNMVVVATPIYTVDHVAIVPRIRNAIGNQFEVMAQDINLTGENISVSLSYVVVEEGIYTVQEHGIQMEAQIVIANLTGKKGNWEAETRSMLNNVDYLSPVVLGQVMTENDPEFSYFWSASQSGVKDLGLPTETAFIAGKGISTQTGSRSEEEVGILIIEAGVYNMQGLNFTAAIGADIVLGIADSGESLYTTGVGSHAIASVMGVDGRDGGWVVLNGLAGSPEGTLSLKIDESNTKRKHSSAERVGYVLFHH